MVRERPTTLLGIAYDRPVVGYGGRTINTLRLWGAATPDDFNFGEFTHGDFFGAVHDKVAAETLTRVLYPDDSTPRGRALRFVQEYFLVACSLADIVARFRRRGNDWHALPDKVAIQLNDTHPALAVAELMRILLDQAQLGWDEAWDLTVRTLAYTNHTLLPEALEKWPVEPVRDRPARGTWRSSTRSTAASSTTCARATPATRTACARMSLIEEGPERRGAHGPPGHRRHAQHQRRGRDPLRAAADDRAARTSPSMFPERFNNKTNGVTPRRWLLLANPDLAGLITEAIGDGWVTDLAQLREARAPGRGRRLPRRLPPGQARGQGPLRRLAASRRPARWSTRTRSSTARSSASTSTSGSCSTCCTSSCSTTACATNPSLDVPPRTVLLRRQGGAGVHTWPS